MRPEDQPYMGVAEVAEYLGKSKQTIHNWRFRARGMHFPSPVKELRAGPVWMTDDIINYAQRMRERHSQTNPSVELMPWHGTDEDCVLCDEPHSPLGGIETTKGWMCYGCAFWVKRLACELPDLEDVGNWREEIDSTP